MDKTETKTEKDTGAEKEKSYMEEQVVKQETEKETIIHSNEDIISLLEDPKNISESEKSWALAQNCETEEEVITKCKEMLKARNDLHL